MRGGQRISWPPLSNNNGTPFIQTNTDRVKHFLSVSIYLSWTELQVPSAFHGNTPDDPYTQASSAFHANTPTIITRTHGWHSTQTPLRYLHASIVGIPCNTPTIVARWNRRHSTQTLQRYLHRSIVCVPRQHPKIVTRERRRHSTQTPQTILTRKHFPHSTQTTRQYLHPSPE